MHLTGHPERKSNREADRQMAVQFKKDTGGRDIDGTAGKLCFVRGKRKRQCERKANSATNFLR